MKKLLFLFAALALVSCNKQENLSDIPTGCSCSSMMDCEADCACGCQN